MPYENSEKRTAIVAAQAAFRQGQIAELKFRLLKKADEADRIWESLNRLGAEIDILIGRAMDQWKANAERTTQRLRNAADQATAAAAGIRRAQATMAQAVAIAGRIDEVVTVVREIIDSIS